MSEHPSNLPARQEAEPRGPGPITIERCVSAWQRIKYTLERDADLADDEQAIVAILDADPSILTPDQLLRRFIAAIAFATAREAEAKTFVAVMRARQQRYAARVMTLRTELLEVMQALDKRSFSDSPFGTVSYRAGPQTAVVIDEGLLPERFWKIERSVRQGDLTAALRAGEVVDGAVLSNPAPVMTLRLAQRSVVDEEVD